MPDNTKTNQKQRIFEMFDKHSAEEKARRDANFREFVSRKLQESKEGKQ